MGYCVLSYFKSCGVQLGHSHKKGNRSILKHGYDNVPISCKVRARPTTCRTLLHWFYAICIYFKPVNFFKSYCRTSYDTDRGKCGSLASIYKSESFHLAYYLLHYNALKSLLLFLLKYLDSN